MSPQELNTVKRFVNPDLRLLIPVLERLIQGRHVPIPNVNLLKASAYPIAEGVLAEVAGLSSKVIRSLRVDDEMNCIFKLGPILTPGELLAWTKKLKKLSSTRHRNILLRAMHGDIFSNSRLLKFGLRNSASCANCGEQVETIQHRLMECPQARTSWEILEQTKQRLNLNVLTNLTIENVIGTKDDVSKLELALQAELILKLSTKSDGYNPRQMVRNAVLMVCNSETLDQETRTRFESFKRER